MYGTQLHISRLNTILINPILFFKIDSLPNLYSAGSVSITAESIFGQTWMESPGGTVLVLLWVENRTRAEWQ
jgi:hypothetical protein